MLDVDTKIVEGNGTLPKEVGLNSWLFLDASSNTGNTFEWDLVSAPENSNPIFTSPITSTTKFGQLDKVGVYQIRLWINRNMYGQKSKTISFNVPGTISDLPLPSDPDFYKGGSVRNGNFELPGILPGWALFWTTVDTEGLLDEHAGVTRGRCIPTNFTATDQYVMCLGDDIGLEDDFEIGGEFSVEQEVDVTNAKYLKLALKFIKR